MFSLGRPISTIFWFAVFLAILLSIPYLASPHLNQTMISCALSRNLLSIDHSISEMHQSGETSRSIIVGPSYAAQLGDVPNMYNLGFGGAYPSEYVAIVSAYSQPQDRVFCLITIRDVATARQQARQIITNDLRRKVQIIKMAGLSGFGLFRRADTPPPEQFRPEIYDLQKRLLHPVKKINIQPLKNLYTAHPNTVFVIFPTLDTNDPAINALEQRFRAKLARAEFPVIDLYGEIPSDMFLDFCHLNSDGIAIMRDKISTL